MRRSGRTSVERVVQARKPALAPLPPPEGLEVATFNVDSDCYAILAFPIAEPPLPSGLSSAEQAVVRGVLAGHSNSEIAASRATSVHTVANQLRSIYEKLDVSGRVELVRYCLRREGSRSGTEVE